MKQRQLEATIMDMIQCRTLDLRCGLKGGLHSRRRRRGESRWLMLVGKIHGCGWGIAWVLILGGWPVVIRQKLVAGVEELYGYLSFRTCMLLRLKMMSIFSEVQAKLVESLQYILSINCFFWYTGSLLQPRMGKRREHKEGFWSCTSKDFPTIVTYQRESNSINGQCPARGCSGRFMIYNHYKLYTYILYA